MIRFGESDRRGFQLNTSAVQIESLVRKKTISKMVTGGPMTHKSFPLNYFSLGVGY